MTGTGRSMTFGACWQEQSSMTDNPYKTMVNIVSKLNEWQLSDMKLETQASTSMNEFLSTD